MSNRFVKAALFILLLFASAAPSVFPSQNGLWQEYKGKHFIIHLKHDNPDLAKTIVSTSEKLYLALCAQWGVKKPRWSFSKEKKIHLYFFNDKEEYIAASQRPHWSRASGDYRKREIFSYAGGAFLEKDLPHELTHFVFREALQAEGIELPLWIEEGAALASERPRSENLEGLLYRNAEQESLIPLEELHAIRNLSGKDADFVSLFYAQSLSLVEFLIARSSHEQFLYFSRLIGEGMALDEALTGAFGRIIPNLDLLQTWWLDSLSRS